MALPLIKMLATRELTVPLSRKLPRPVPKSRLLTRTLPHSTATLPHSRAVSRSVLEANIAKPVRWESLILPQVRRIAKPVWLEVVRAGAWSLPCDAHPVVRGAHLQAEADDFHG